MVTGTTVSSTWANNTLTDIATGLSTCILKDGTQTTTATIPFANPITYGGVTLANAVTGTGNMVLSASPTFTGTVAAANINASGTITGNSLDLTSLGSAWTDYTPSVSADTGSWNAPSIAIARYKILGKLMLIQLYIASTAASGTPSEYRVLIPESRSGKTVIETPALVVNNGVVGVGKMKLSTSTYMAFTLINEGAYTTSAGARFIGVIELA